MACDRFWTFCFEFFDLFFILYLRHVVMRPFACSGLEMPFAPLSTQIVCWNNQMTVENEAWQCLHELCESHVWVLPDAKAEIACSLQNVLPSLFLPFYFHSHVTGARGFWMECCGCLPAPNGVPFSAKPRTSAEMNTRWAFRSSAFRRNADGLSNSYRTGHLPQSVLFFFFAFPPYIPFFVCAKFSELDEALYVFLLKLSSHPVLQRWVDVETSIASFSLR